MSASNGSGQIRVLLLAGSAVRRAGLESLVRGAPQLKLVGSLEQGSHLAQHAAELNPDVLVHDLETASSRKKIATVPAVLFVEDVSASFLAEALRQGVRAILRRDVPGETLTSGIISAHRGLVLLDGSLAGKLASSVPSTSTDELGLTEQLTTRESEVLRMVAEGLGNRDIARAMGISDHTVKFHISSIFDKLGASTRTEAVMLGVRMGLILL